MERKKARLFAYLKSKYARAVVQWFKEREP